MAKKRKSSGLTDKAYRRIRGEKVVGISLDQGRRDKLDVIAKAKGGKKAGAEYAIDVAYDLVTGRPSRASLREVAGQLAALIDAIEREPDAG